MPLIAVLHNKAGEIVVTKEGFQLMQFSEDFNASLVYHVDEPVAQHDLFLALTNPETKICYKLQLGNPALEPGEEVSINVDLLQAVAQNERPKH